MSCVNNFNIIVERVDAQGILAAAIAVGFAIIVDLVVICVMLRRCCKKKVGPIEIPQQLVDRGTSMESDDESICEWEDRQESLVENFGDAVENLNGGAVEITKTLLEDATEADREEADSGQADTAETVSIIYTDETRRGSLHSTTTSDSNHESKDSGCEYTEGHQSITPGLGFGPSEPPLTPPIIITDDSAVENFLSKGAEKLCSRPKSSPPQLQAKKVEMNHVQLGANAVEIEQSTSGPENPSFNGKAANGSSKSSEKGASNRIVSTNCKNHPKYPRKRITLTSGSKIHPEKSPIEKAQIHPTGVPLLSDPYGRTEPMKLKAWHPRNPGECHQPAIEEESESQHKEPQPQTVIQDMYRVDRSTANLKCVKSDAAKRMKRIIMNKRNTVTKNL